VGFSIKKENEWFDMTKIDKVELHEFQFEAENLGLSANTTQ
jgi:hypothetical protein